MASAATIFLSRAGSALLVLSAAWAEGVAEQAPTATIVKAAEATWHPGPAAFPAGLEITVLQGDPGKEGPFVVRLRLPAAYRIPVHTHGGAEHVTLITGDLKVGVGKRFDAASLTALAVGDFASIPADLAHFAATEGGAVLQVHGLGPLSITCLDEGHATPAPAK